MSINHDVGIIEGVYDIALPKVPTSLHRWGRVVWLQDIEIGSQGRFLYIKDGQCSSTHLSRITNVIKATEYVEIHTENNIYKLRLLPVNPHS
ncbi:MAG TPA: hypothetical protein GX523_07995 [Desulfitobacterium dehalogenans]|uniref:Uncharacterized protein n=1 Tax=Desulfitobacterium dehalogenans TaxID=36854 RepID=A0A7C7D5E3_9FIRM|nr:hypothetical protein [Desulfitobacterium dehalogenans]